MISNIPTSRMAHCGFCAKADIFISGINSISLADPEADYIPWFCCHLCCEMKKYSLGMKNMDPKLYKHYLETIYRKVNQRINETDSNVIAETLK